MFLRKSKQPHMRLSILGGARVLMMTASRPKRRVYERRKDMSNQEEKNIADLIKIINEMTDEQKKYLLCFGEGILMAGQIKK